MDKVLRHLAIANMIEGCIIVLMQLAMLVTLHDWVDWICIGFWGGGLMVLAGMWTLQRSQKKMITTAALAIFSGLCMVGFYSWHVSTVDCDDSDGPTTDPDDRQARETSWENDSDVCDWRLASDILFIIFGCITIGINMFLAARASTIVGAQPRRRSSSSSHGHHHPPAHHHAGPVQHTIHVTAAPAPNYPYPQSQQHAYPPSGPPQQAGYPPYPNQQPYNPNYPPSYKD